MTYSIYTNIFYPTDRPFPDLVAPFPAVRTKIPRPSSTLPKRFCPKELENAINGGKNDFVAYLLLLLPSCGELDTRNEFGETALHVAARCRQVRILRLLFIAGANTRYVDNEGNTPLQVAVMSGDLDCVRALTTPVTVCEVEGAFLQYSPLIIYPDTEQDNEEGLTCVHQAFNDRNFDILNYLVLDACADIDACEDSGDTILHVACLSGNASLVNALIDLGADPSVINEQGLTPYDVAHPHIRQVLEDRGAIPEAIQEMENNEGHFRRRG